MSESPTGTLAIVLVGFVGMVLMLSLPSVLGDGVLPVLLFGLIAFVFISVVLTLIFAFDPDSTDDELEQLEHESNGRHLIRVWWTIMKFFMKAPFMAVVLLPSKLRDLRTWLTQKPRDTGRGDSGE